MATSFTENDISIIESAIKSGELKIRFDSGREIQYRTVAELIRAKNHIKQELLAASEGAERGRRPRAKSYTTHARRVLL